MKILVVDDSRAMRMLLVHMLRTLKYGDGAILEAGSGQEALELIQLHRPSLVISDLYMPGMDGLELWRRVRDAGLDQRFGLVTAATDKPTRHLAADADVHFVLTKPFTEERLDSTLRQAFSRRPANLRTGPVHVAVPEDASVFSIRLLVQKLIRCRTEVGAAREPLDLDVLADPILARYILPDGECCGYAMLERPLGVRLAAALTMLPPSVLREELKNRNPDGVLESNLHEVLSIFAQLFNRGGRIRARLDRIWAPAEPPSNELIKLLPDPSWRADASIAIAGYGSGDIAVIGAGGRKILRRGPHSKGQADRRPVARGRNGRPAPTTGELLARRRR